MLKEYIIAMNMPDIQYEAGMRLQFCHPSTVAGG